MDETLAEAHLGLAMVKLYYEWDKAGAQEAFQRALEINPNLVEAHRHYGWCLILFDRDDEAIAHLKRAKELDPLTPIYTAELGWINWGLGRYEEAKEEAQKSLELHPDFPIGWYVLGGVNAEQGMYDEAIAAHEKAGAASPEFGIALRVTYAMAGRRDDALKKLAELEQASAPGDPFFLAIFHTALGEKDEAFRWLEAGYECRHRFMPWLRHGAGLSRLPPSPTHQVPSSAIAPLEPLRDDPRFQDLLDRVKLPQ